MPFKLLKHVRVTAQSSRTPVANTAIGRVVSSDMSYTTVACKTYKPSNRSRQVLEHVNTFNSVVVGIVSILLHPLSYHACDIVKYDGERTLTAGRKCELATNMTDSAEGHQLT